MVMGANQKETSAHFLFILRDTIPIEIGRGIVVQKITPAIKLGKLIE
jgi:hypothetical protein